MDEYNDYMRLCDLKEAIRQELASDDPPMITLEKIAEMVGD